MRLETLFSSYWEKKRQVCVVQTTFAQILAEKIISANKDVIQTDEGAFMYHMRIKISDFFLLKTTVLWNDLCYRKTKDIVGKLQHSGTQSLFEVLFTLKIEAY